MPELYASISFLLPSAVDAAVTGTDMALVFGPAGMYIPKARRSDSHYTIPQHYTSDRSSLGKMRGVAKRLKQMNPQLMNINDDTIIEFSKEASKSDWESSVAYYQPFCQECYGSGETYEKLSGANYFENELSNERKLVACAKCVRGISPHIYVSLDFLRSPVIYLDHDEASAFNRPEWLCRKFTGDFALILLTCHELAHDFSWHLKANHGKKWQRWFAKFLRQIINDMKSN